MSNSCQRQTLPARWDVVYYALLAVIFGVAIHLRVQLPAIPFLDPDSWDYLRPAIAPFTGREAVTNREFLYPWLLRTILQIWPDFRVITVIQHSAGVLAAVLLLLAWHRMRVFLPGGMTVNICHRIGGLLITTLYLFAAIFVVDEHKIRPEVFFVLVIALCLYLATEFSRKVFEIRHFGLREGVLGVLLIFLSAAAYYLRPYFGFGVLCVLLPLLIACIFVRGSWMIKGGSVGIGVILVFTLLVKPDRYSHSKHATGNKSFLAQSLFCGSVETIYDLLQEDARTLPAHDPKRPIVENLLRAMDQKAGQPGRLYAGFTRFDPDDIRYRGPMGELSKSLQHDETRLRDFCYESYLRAWKHYPLRMVKKIVVQLWVFYSPRRYRVYDCMKSLDVSFEVGRTKEILSERLHGYLWGPFQDYGKRAFSWKGTPQSVNLPKVGLFISRIMNATYSLTFVLTLIAAAALHLGWLQERGQFLKKSSLWALYLFSYNLGMCFTIAFVFVMGQRRYTYGQILFSSLSQCFATVFLLCVILAAADRLRARRKSKMLYSL